MKIGAYQFAVSGSIDRNLQAICQAVWKATEQKVRLLVFPECALTGYPPYDLENSAAVDFKKLEAAFERLRHLSRETGMYLVVGSITKDGDTYHNSAITFAPDGSRSVSHKRALWGWDRDNFSPAVGAEILNVDGFRVGVRICFEVRFPEFFRELYRKTDLNLILFYDVSREDSADRYELIKAHIRTRSVENVCHTLSVDAIAPWQTAPTALFDRSGGIVAELERNREGLLVCDLEMTDPDFGEQGRLELSDWLVHRPCE